MAKRGSAQDLRLEQVILHPYSALAESLTLPLCCTSQSIVVLSIFACFEASPAIL